MNIPMYYAHSGLNLDKSDWQTLPDHLNAVAKLASHNARFFGGESLANLAGLLHDLGKYSVQFQARLEGSSIRADHATAGAQIAVKKYGKLGQLVAFAIAGHHAGLANGIDEGDSRSTLQARLALQMGDDRLPKIDSRWQSEINLPENLTEPNINCEKKEFGFQLALYTRMIFSCLIDADRTDTQNFSLMLEGKPAIKNSYASLAQLRDKLDKHLGSLQQKAKPTQLNTLRTNILNHARQRARLPKGLFTLTVPTGGGKTLSSMAFALDHALKHDQRRVIYVIPFTSIIEQNAKVFKDAFGDLASSVIEHHSAFDRDKAFNSSQSSARTTRPDFNDKLKIAMESWDSPVVVTTAVQFFESLFSDRPSQCRKLHNIAGSVIVLDEAQTLPLKLLRPIMAVIKELARNYNSTVVLCTATQPALLASKKPNTGFLNGFENVCEIAPEPEQLFKHLKRAEIKYIAEQTDDQLVAHLRAYPQVLMIVNNRRHARSLYDAIHTEAGSYHLSTLMIAKHRTEILDEIRLRLKTGQVCKLVSTSLIEAGVDIDFPRVFRAETGLDSIAQAAGRCNREGNRALEESIVSVFQSPQWPAPPELEQLAGNMRSVMRNHAGDLLAPEAMNLYFRHVYHGKSSGSVDGLDSKNLMKMHSDHISALTFPFQNIAKALSMIDSHLLPVIVPIDKVAQQLIQDLRFSQSVGGIARKLQMYLVQIPKTGFDALRQFGAIACIEPEKFGDQFWVLEKMDLYSNTAGLSWHDPVFTQAEHMVM
jgi:CRISPR-associated endonuclease/helicase Cas3